jgi:trehalose 6-phosphate phosphatase
LELQTPSANSFTRQSRMSNLPLLNLEQTAFFLDVDGTMLDIAPTPDAVTVPRELVDALAHLSRKCGGAVAVVSGRTLESIDKLFAPLILPAAGTHGAQVRLSAETPVEHLGRPIPAELRQVFTSLADKPGMFIEDKEMTLAIHYRLAAEPAFDPARVAAVEAMAGTAGFTLLHGKKVLELKPTGTDKGAALRTFMSNPPFKGRRAVFAGDDVTDGYAFAVLGEFHGLGIAVGCHFAGAHYHLEGPAQLRNWITGLLDASGGDAPILV